MNNPKFAVITISDRSSEGIREDRSGPKLVELIEAENWAVHYTSIVPDEVDKIIEQLMQCITNPVIDVIFTTGGTGFAPRDVTPEATRMVIQKDAPGIAEALRRESGKITPFAMLSRGLAGIAGKTLIVNLPGNPKAVAENFEILKTILPHAIEIIQDSPTSEISHHAD